MLRSSNSSKRDATRKMKMMRVDHLSARFTLKCCCAAAAAATELLLLAAAVTAAPAAPAAAALLHLEEGRDAQHDDDER